MKPLISDELYNSYVSQLKVLSLKKQKNIMHDFTLGNIYITNFCNEDGILTIKVFLLVSFYDYVVDADNNVVRGNNSVKVSNIYRLTYVKKRKVNENNNCPNCGATLENLQTTNCSYCRTTITNNNHNWILTKKEILNNKVKDK